VRASRVTVGAVAEGAVPLVLVLYICGGYRRGDSGGRGVGRSPHCLANPAGPGDRVSLHDHPIDRGWRSFWTARGRESSAAATVCVS